MHLSVRRLTACPLQQSILTSTTEDLALAGELDLSRDEDSVSCLAVGQRKGRGSLLYAGINSSAAEISKGKNEHFRSFAFEPTKRVAGASTSKCRVAELSRTSMFEANHAEKYQRIVRLAHPPWANSQFGAVASGFGTESEIALFEVSNTGSPAPKSKGTLQLSREASDVDVIPTGEESWKVVYCDNFEMFILDVSKGSARQPESIFQIPVDAPGGRPQFRVVRFLTPEFVLAATNLPKRAGVVLQGFRLPTKPNENARLAISVKLPRKVSATAFAVRNLSPPSHPAAKVDKTQFAVAVAGHDSSISVYTLEHKTSGDISLIYDLLPLKVFTEVHGLQITGLALSHFTPPAKTTSRQQYIKLASISMEDTAVVHSIPLRKLIDRPASSTTPRRGPPRPVRYVVAVQSQRPDDKYVIGALSLIVLLLALVGQVVLEILGASPPMLGAARAFGSHPSAANLLRNSYNPRNEFINSILGGIDAADAFPRSKAKKKIVLRDEPVLVSTERDGGASQIQVNLQEAGAEGADDEGKGAYTWEDLTARQKTLWKERLKEAGHWGDGMGETVFKGLLFGEIAGAVGRAVGG